MLQQKLSEKFWWTVKRRFLDTCNFPNHEKNKFILVFGKSVYSYEYMAYWDRFNKTSLPEKGDLYRHLNMEDITGGDYAHAKNL